MRIAKKQIEKWLSENAEIKIWQPDAEKIPTWYSKIDGAYLTFENLIMDLKWMLEKGITEKVQGVDPDHKVCCIGFNPTEQKWYGWSHRAVYGFGIGSECKKGDCGYVSKDMADFLERSIQFWSDEAHENVSAIEVTNDKGITGAQVTWDYVSEKVPNKSLHGTIGETFAYPPQKWGKGEWTALTMEDAKQMAIDFAEGLS